MRNLIVVLAVLCFVPSWASEPGEPLDCSDFVFLEPGLTCTTWVPFPCDLHGICDLGATPDWAFDNEGRVLFLPGTESVVLPECASEQELLTLRRFDGTSDVLIGFIAPRCNNPPMLGWDEIADFSGIAFDPTEGRLLIHLRSFCSGPSCAEGGPISPYDGDWIASIEGFTTTFEILQTFEPTSGPIGFRVPYMPEGFPAADHFDTYYGDITSVGDWSEAKPLQCGYPATAPEVGDYLTVADTLPELKPGEGRYFVTAVTHQGETRYGRKSSGGVLTGRDPAVLPGCAE